jgi:hypothetical protein
MALQVKNLGRLGAEKKKEIRAAAKKIRETTAKGGYS